MCPITFQRFTSNWSFFFHKISSEAMQYQCLHTRLTWHNLPQSRKENIFNCKLSGKSWNVVDSLPKPFLGCSQSASFFSRIVFIRYCCNPPATSSSGPDSPEASVTCMLYIFNRCLQDKTMTWLISKCSFNSKAPDGVVQQLVVSQSPAQSSPSLALSRSLKPTGS